MGCGAGKIEKSGGIPCSKHKKLEAESLCLFAACDSCQKDSFALCPNCKNQHLDFLNGEDRLFLQDLNNLRLEKVNYYRYLTNDSEQTVQAHLNKLEMLLRQRENGQIKLQEFLKQIYIPLQEIQKFSLELIEREKDNDFDITNALGLYTGTIKGDGMVLDASHSLIRRFDFIDKSIRNSQNKIQAYYSDTGAIKDNLSQSVGYVELNKDGAAVFDHNMLPLGSIGRDGIVKDKAKNLLGECKADKIKVAFEFFFSHIIKA